MVETAETNKSVREEIHKALDNCLDIEEKMAEDLTKSEFVIDFMKLMLKLAVERGAEVMMAVD